jgi:hypothetical protein
MVSSARMIWRFIHLLGLKSWSCISVGPKGAPSPANCRPYAVRRVWSSSDSPSVPNPACRRHSTDQSAWDHVSRCMGIRSVSAYKSDAC